MEKGGAEMVHYDFGRLAQLVRALPSHGRGLGFESLVAHHLPSPGLN